jgi:hypothetical protein
MTGEEMTSFTYNDLAFSVVAAGDAWDLARGASGDRLALVGAGLFKGCSADEALTRAQALAKCIYPVGIKVVGPDVAHPALIGDLKIVGPNVAHPNFVNWDKDSASFQSGSPFNQPSQDKS